MLISARQASEILSGAGLSREEARRVLLAGLAGRGERMPGALLYDDSAVRRLAARPCVEEKAIDDLCPHGLFVGRVARWRPIDVTGDRDVLAESVCGGWRLSVFERILVTSRVDRFGPMPFLATLCGYVAFGAEVSDLAVDRAGHTAFGLTEAGAWFEAFQGRRLLAGAGRGCFIWNWPPRYRG